MDTNNYRQSLLERFVKYVKIWTTSDTEQADNGIQPSTSRQNDFAKILSTELQELLKDQKNSSVEITPHCYVVAKIPATTGFENCPTIGFLAHMDTVDEVCGENVKPQVLTDYNGSIIRLQNDVVLDPATDMHLNEAAKNHETIITTDGTTLLGADDKAGIAAIMTAFQQIFEQKLSHGPLEIIFSPDEETGHGMDNVPFSQINSKVCFTLDGGHIGELEVECFNAYKSVITFTGKAKHTGTARPDMVNAITMASSFLSMLPHHESPETTDGYQGFYAPMGITGSIEQAVLTLYIRDFTNDGMARRLETLKIIGQATEMAFSGSKVCVENSIQYKNMKENLEKHPEIIQNMLKAASELNIKPVFSPIRGGTDGSRLTEMGLPTPNIFTGGHNYHSRIEWASLDQMEKSKDFVIQLIKVYSNEGVKK